jgi:hypothetical protein
MKPLGKAFAPGASEAESQKAMAVFSESAISSPSVGGKKKHKTLELTTTVFPDGPVGAEVELDLRRYVRRQISICYTKIFVSRSLPCGTVKHEHGVKNKVLLYLAKPFDIVILTFWW